MSSTQQRSEFKHPLPPPGVRNFDLDERKAQRFEQLDRDHQRWVRKITEGIREHYGLVDATAHSTQAFFQLWQEVQDYEASQRLKQRGSP